MKDIREMIDRYLDERMSHDEEQEFFRYLRSAELPEEFHEERELILQMAAMQEEKTKLEAERAENQRMMQELLALKAQLDQKNGGEGTPPAEPASEVAPTEHAKTDEISETKSEDGAPAETTDENQ